MDHGGCHANYGLVGVAGGWIERVAEPHWTEISGCCQRWPVLGDARPFEV